MQNVFFWVLQNKEWLFSGIGVALLGLLVQFMFLRKTKGTVAKGEQVSESETGLVAVDRGHRFEFADGVVAYSDIRGSWHLTDIFAFSANFKSAEQFAKSIAPTIHSLAAHHLEKYTYEEAKRHRIEVANRVTKEIQSRVGRFGIVIDLLRDTMRSGRSKNHKTVRRMNTQIRYRLHPKQLGCYLTIAPR